MARALDKSERQPPLGCLDATVDVPWAGGSTCDLTLYLRPAGGAERVTEAASRLVEERLAGGTAAHLSSAEAEDLVRPHAHETEAVVRALKDHGIAHVHAVGRRAVHVQGRWEDLDDLLSVERMRFRTAAGILVGRAGPITLTDPALDPVVAVFGLDNRRAVSSYVIKSHVIKSHVIKSHVIKSHVIKSARDQVPRDQESRDQVPRHQVARRPWRRDGGGDRRPGAGVVHPGRDRRLVRLPGRHRRGRADRGARVQRDARRDRPGGDGRLRRGAADEVLARGAAAADVPDDPVGRGARSWQLAVGRK